ncbi:hydroxymethylglutaryl-CoA lyase [Litoreibacter ascidiaceicola]|uniref:Hydroxymethylglutaryl-CoA lyase n=1 Tax=Litoreibacter ascidiaceicola TaxID=1486859 RepID=A0A1M4TQK9_9RHOB|nr:hydroxymethylglutaryl-CoA lyase [Litoreibacter ascidiaceicola]SHE46674.1 hydroxymethylglutaryl-CoA lyase [Litoreibacter ascidiaceicola]
MSAVEIFEVGPRDGLQNEKAQIATADKIALVDMLSTAGFKRIEVASFVSPKWVPQMADSAEVLHGITRADGVSYAALTPNMRGLEGAIAAKADEVAVFASASEGFSKANVNATIEESIARFIPIMEAAPMPVRGYVSCVAECPYDGPTDPADVARVVARLFKLGCYEVSLGDTIGRATPEQIDAMLTAVTQVCAADKLAGHFHDTAGRALLNIDVALSHGVRVFDAAVAGLGGCPYAPGAAGNVATEAVLAHLESAGHPTGLDADIVARAGRMAQAMRG